MILVTTLALESLIRQLRNLLGVGCHGLEKGAHLFASGLVTARASSCRNGFFEQALDVNPNFNTPSLSLCGQAGLNLRAQFNLNHSLFLLRDIIQRMRDRITSLLTTLDGITRDDAIR